MTAKQILYTSSQVECYSTRRGLPAPLSSLPLLSLDLAILEGKFDQHAIAIKAVLHTLKSSWAITDIVSMQPLGEVSTDFQRQRLYLQQ